MASKRPSDSGIGFSKLRFQSALLVNDVTDARHCDRLA